MSELGTMIRARYEHLVGDPIDIDALLEGLESPPATSLETEPARRRLPAVAAVVAILVLGAVAFWAGWLVFADSDQVVDDPATSTTQPSPPSTTPGDAAGISLATLESSEAFYTGHQVQLGIAGNGLPFLSYLVEYEDASYAYRIVTCADTACDAHTPGVDVAITDWAQEGSVAVGPDGLPAVAVLDHDGEQQHVRLITCRDATCSAVDDHELGLGQFPSLVIPDDGLPLVTFGRFDGLLVAVKCGDRTCAEIASTSVFPTEQWEFGRLHIGSDGLPFVAYDRYDEALQSSVLTIVGCDDRACTGFDTADVPLPSGPGEEAYLADVAVGADGNPTFVLSQEHFQLLVQRCADPACAAVDPAVRIGPRRARGDGLAMAIPADGLPVIAFSFQGGGQGDGDPGPGALHVAKCDDPACASGTIARVADGETIWSVAIAMDGNNPLIAYHAPPGELVVARCGDPACLDGAAEVTTWSAEDPEFVATPLGPIMEGWVALEVEGLPGRFGGGMGSVAVGGDGTIVVAGTASRTEAGATGLVVVADAADPSSWQVIELPDAGDVGSVVAAGPGFVVGGSSCGSDAVETDCAPGIWVSSDGLAWERIADPAVFVPTGSCEPEFCLASIDRLVAGEDRMVALGSDGDGAAFWVSDDGLSWDRVPMDFLPEGEAWIDGLAHFPGGFLATGGAGMPVLDEEGEWVDYVGMPLFLRSTDGIAWQVTDAPFPDAYTTWSGRPTAWAGGIFVSGASCDADYDCVMTAFTSADGIGWEPVALPPELSGQGDLQSFAVGGSLVFAGGTFDQGLGLEQGLFVVTNDLQTWEVFGVDPDVFPGMVPFNDMSLLPNGTMIGVGSGDRSTGFSGIYVLPG